MKMKYRCLSCFNHIVEYVSSVNLKENKRNLEIPRISYSCCLLDCRTIELSDYRAVGQAIGSPPLDPVAHFWLSSIRDWNIADTALNPKQLINHF